jgi:hypothetical protein
MGFANKRLISARVKKSAEEEGRSTENKGVNVALFLEGDKKVNSQKNARLGTAV